MKWETYLRLAVPKYRVSLCTFCELALTIYKLKGAGIHQQKTTSELNRDCVISVGLMISWLRIKFILLLCVKCILSFIQNCLKGLAQAKIIKKSVILFWVLNMTIWCKHVQRLELQFLFIFCAAHLPVRLDIETKFPISNYWQPCQK